MRVIVMMREALRLFVLGSCSGKIPAQAWSSVRVRGSGRLRRAERLMAGWT